MLRELSIAVGVLFLLTACSTKKQPIIKQEKIEKPQQKIIIDTTEKEDLNWRGYYFGILPCDDCNGIKTWIKLSGTKEDISYSLIENYDGIEGKIINSSGKAKWSSSDSIVTLKDKMIFVGENFITFINEPSEMLKSQYTLEKLEVFKSSDSTFYLSPRSMQDGTINGNRAWKFNGVENVENNQDFLSTEGTYIVNCDEKTYDLPRVIFYQKSFAMGKILNSITKDEENYLPIKSDSAIKKIFDSYCKKTD